MKYFTKSKVSGNGDLIDGRKGLKMHGHVLTCTFGSSIFV